MLNSLNVYFSCFSIVYIALNTFQNRARVGLYGIIIVNSRFEYIIEIIISIGSRILLIGLIPLYTDSIIDITNLCVNVGT